MRNPETGGGGGGGEENGGGGDGSGEAEARRRARDRWGWALEEILAMLGDGSHFALPHSTPGQPSTGYLFDSSSSTSQQLPVFPDTEDEALAAAAAAAVAAAETGASALPPWQPTQPLSGVGEEGGVGSAAGSAGSSSGGLGPGSARRLVPILLQRPTTEPSAALVRSSIGDSSFEEKSAYCRSRKRKCDGTLRKCQRFKHAPPTKDEKPKKKPSHSAKRPPASTATEPPPPPPPPVAPSPAGRQEKVELEPLSRSSSSSSSSVGRPAGGYSGLGSSLAAVLEDGTGPGGGERWGMEADVGQRRPVAYRQGFMDDGTPSDPFPPPRPRSMAYRQERFIQTAPQPLKRKASDVEQQQQQQQQQQRSARMRVVKPPAEYSPDLAPPGFGDRYTSAAAAEWMQGLDPPSSSPRQMAVAGGFGGGGRVPPPLVVDVTGMPYTQQQPMGVGSSGSRAPGRYGRV
ncbi:hypothetical protein HDU96_006994 [Phlyctochytrium bullatum]|nr:hypothetical protein HDU96_006994 [Phlyctochytrium bullatum]